MDVLNPEILVIGKRRYRKNPIMGMEDSDFLQLSSRPTHTVDVDDKYCDDNEEEERNAAAMAKADDQYDAMECTIVERLNNHECQIKLPVPNVFHKFLIGPKGETLKRMEADTKCRIRVPRQQSNKPGGSKAAEAPDEVVVITASSAGHLRSAETRIKLLVLSSRGKMPFTHFLSIPVTDASIGAKVLSFKEQVLLYCLGDRGVEESIFVEPSSLHLTLTMLLLVDQREVASAAALLQSTASKCWPSALHNASIALRGLEYMNDDPSEVDVLYIKVDQQEESGRLLQTFCDSVMKEFVRCDLARDTDKCVKLHVTVMNSNYRATEESDRMNKTRKSFNARQILAKFGDFDFGLLKVSEVHISIRYSLTGEGYFRNAFVWKPTEQR